MTGGQKDLATLQEGGEVFRRTVNAIVRTELQRDESGICSGGITGSTSGV